MGESSVSRNGLAFIALANEFCHDIEHALEYEQEEFVAKMLKLLPRIYIAATDIPENDEDENYCVDPYLEEITYDRVKDNMSKLLGENDVYLEVFEEDMKYSDTPIANSISENLADIYQDLYNFVTMVQDSYSGMINVLLVAIKDSFVSYWGQTLVNVQRALHNVKYNSTSFD